MGLSVRMFFLFHGMGAGDHIPRDSIASLIRESFVGLHLHFCYLRHVLRVR